MAFSYRLLSLLHPLHCPSDKTVKIRHETLTRTDQRVLHAHNQNEELYVVIKGNGRLFPADTKNKNPHNLLILQGSVYLLSPLGFSLSDLPGILTQTVNYCNIRDLIISKPAGGTIWILNFVLFCLPFGNQLSVSIYGSKILLIF